MSKIALAPDENGTGIFTIASPNSNTNRTLTLPDDAGTILTDSGNQAADFASLTVNSNNISADNSLGFRNRIINGDMRIDQRNAGAAVTASGAYPVDRFFFLNGSDGAFSAQQDSSAPAGFNISTKVTVTTEDASIGTSQYAVFVQYIEGYNAADLNWGTANAKTITLSFWVRSSLTGTFGGYIRNAGNDYTYPYTYTISSADTWEYKTVTIAGPTAGTWLYTNGRGMAVGWSLAAGSAQAGTAGSWAATGYLGAAGQTQVMSTLNATWYITGVQLEVGSVATPFERRPYGTELSLCQRYYIKFSAADGNGGYGTFFGGASSSDTAIFIQPVFPVQLRSYSPTQSWGGSIRIASPLSANGLSSLVASNQQIGVLGGYGVYTCASTGAGVLEYARIEGNGDPAAYWAFSAEL